MRHHTNGQYFEPVAEQHASAATALSGGASGVLTIVHTPSVMTLSAPAAPAVRCGCLAAR